MHVVVVVVKSWRCEVTVIFYSQHEDACWTSHPHLMWTAQGMDTDELNQVVSSLDVAEAKCLYEEDKMMIIGNIM